MIKIKEIVGTVEVCAFLCAISTLLVSSSVNAIQKCTKILKHTYHKIVRQYSTYKSVLGYIPSLSKTMTCVSMELCFLGTKSIMQRIMSLLWIKNKNINNTENER